MCTDCGCTEKIQESTCNCGCEEHAHTHEGLCNCGCEEHRTHNHK